MYFSLGEHTTKKNTTTPVRPGRWETVNKKVDGLVEYDSSARCLELYDSHKFLYSLGRMVEMAENLNGTNFSPLAKMPGRLQSRFSAIKARHGR